MANQFVIQGCLLFAEWEVSPCAYSQAAGPGSGVMDQPWLCVRQVGCKFHLPFPSDVTLLTEPYPLFPIFEKEVMSTLNNWVGMW